MATLLKRLQKDTFCTDSHGQSDFGPVLAVEIDQMADWLQKIGKVPIWPDFVHILVVRMNT